MVRDDDLRQRVSAGPDRALRARVKVTPTGRARTVLSCQSALTGVQVAADLRVLGVGDRGEIDARALRDRRPPPARRPGLPVIASRALYASLIFWNTSGALVSREYFLGELRRRASSGEIRHAQGGTLCKVVFAS